MHPASSQPASPPTLISRFSQLLRIILGLALLIWVLSRANWAELINLSDQIAYAWLVLFILITPVNVGLSVWKWQLVLQVLGHRVGFAKLFVLYVLSQFYNNLLPSSVGGDVVRVAILGRRIHSPVDALRSVVIERFTGLTVLIALGVVAIALATPLRHHVPLLLLVLAGLSLYGLITLAVFEPRLLRLLEYTCRPIAMTRKPIARLQHFQQSLRSFTSHRRALLVSLILSLLFHVGAIVNVYLACRTLGQPVSWQIVAVITPIALVITLLPISFNGVGLREWVFFVSFELLGVSGTFGLAASLLVRFKQMLWSSSGLLVHLCLTPTAETDPPAPQTPTPDRPDKSPAPADAPY